jgi:subtilase family serine protease
MIVRLNINSIICMVLLMMLSSSCEKFNLEKYPDLVVNNIYITPSQVGPGSNIAVSCEIVNQGNEVADFPYLQFEGLHYFISSDAVYDISDTDLGSTNIDDIDAGKSRDIQEDLQIPSGYAAGNCYILFYIDYDREVEELNENNNVGSYLIQVTK